MGLLLFAIAIGLRPRYANAQAIFGVLATEPIDPQSLDVFLSVCPPEALTIPVAFLQLVTALLITAILETHYC